MSVQITSVANNNNMKKNYETNNKEKGITRG